MQDGSCQPLINSTDPSITPEERATKPFEGIVGSWTHDWIHLLRDFEKYEYSGVSQEELKKLPITFLERIFSEKLMSEGILRKIVQDSLNQVAKQESLLMAPSTSIIEYTN